MKRSKFISNLSCLGALSVVTPGGLLYSQTAFSETYSFMKNSIQLIRNATLVIHYAGKKILVDPLLAEKGAYNPFAGGERNPTVELPLSVEDIIENTDLVLVSHTHSDHFDSVAREVLPRDVKIVNQPADEDYFQKLDFSNTHTLQEHLLWNDINIHRTGGKHGSGEIGKRMGTVSGFVLQAKDQPTIYIIGDSIWTEEVAQAIEEFKPDIIVANTGGARFPGYEENPILMDEEQTISLLKASGNARVIAVHMEALDHCTTTRASLQQIANSVNGEVEKLIIPKDGEEIFL
ncbi:MBL fold metallo-hydrolase [Antarcticibacterium flavum]|uniref:MBL fold metallo-hydrolase n=1 Tax=Antarcticibacterium flavum TaxID=2058175 RepID=A0A5B7X286_9FLAO|nr:MULTISPECIES: MBL fold metallo-hydrolase [Antarcticibacterium]QCY69390.1 MBL fold metallo-hydrolase [Antarcticibacterium flavum]